MKPKIKFSHEYYKMPANLNTARLLQVIIVEKSELSKEFIEYDTAYPLDKRVPWEGNGHYELPEGRMLLLLLQSGWLWTTLRRWTPEKERYYKELTGQEIEIIRKED